MAELHGLKMVLIRSPLTDWDDPPSMGNISQQNRLRYPPKKIDGFLVDEMSDDSKNVLLKKGNMLILVHFRGGGVREFDSISPIFQF